MSGRPVHGAEARGFILEETMTKRFLTLAAALALALSLAACGARTSSGMRTVYAMDTVLEITAYGKNTGDALDAAEQALYALDAQLDRHDGTSAVSTLNRDGTVTDAALAALVETALTVGELSGGAFDPTVAPLLDAWDFTGDAPRVPSDGELAALLTRVGLENVSVDGDTVTLKNGAQLDLGGIAKGYAGDEIRTILKEHGVTSAVIDLGGDVALLGAKPDGSDWRVAVKYPANSEKFLGVLSVADTFVVTSGVYERGFEENGVYYHHILDPKTGKPADSGLVSVTVVCGGGAWADALSTACFVLGAEKSLALRDTLAAERLAAIELIFEKRSRSRSGSSRTMFDQSCHYPRIVPTRI